MPAPPTAVRWSAPWSSARSRRPPAKPGSNPMPTKFEVNGKPVEVNVEPRMTLADCLRNVLRLTGTHIGCEHGVCGACTVLLDGETARSCIMLAVQADGAVIRTLESVAGEGGELHPVQQAFWDKHGMQCGFCTPGFVMTVLELLERHPQPTCEEIETWLGG